MITIQRKDTKVIVHIQHGIFYNEYGYNLELTYESDATAELWSRQIRDNMERHLKAIATDAYNQGWKDAKGKKVPKRKYFWGKWKFIPVILLLVIFLFSCSKKTQYFHKIDHPKSS